MQVAAKKQARCWLGTGNEVAASEHDMHIACDTNAKDLEKKF